MKDKQITLILCFLPTGWIGLHKYYLGYKKTTIIYILFIWTLIPIIKSVIDGILILRLDEEDFVEKYCTEEEYKTYVENKNKNIVDELNSEENKSDNNIDEKYLEPDFSDYYGPWSNEDKK